jgi:hypothetical protein
MCGPEPDSKMHRLLCAAVRFLGAVSGCAGRSAVRGAVRGARRRPGHGPKQHPGRGPRPFRHHACGQQRSSQIDLCGSIVAVDSAADIYDLLGPAGERLIRERGRWDTDIAQIYTSVSASAHAALSRTIGDSSGVDLQSLLRGWRQSTATFGRGGSL